MLHFAPSLSSSSGLRNLGSGVSTDGLKIFSISRRSVCFIGIIYLEQPPPLGYALVTLSMPRCQSSTVVKLYPLSVSLGRNPFLSLHAISDDWPVTIFSFLTSLFPPTSPSFPRDPLPDLDSVFTVPPRSHCVLGQAMIRNALAALVLLMCHFFPLNAFLNAMFELAEFTPCYRRSSQCTLRLLTMRFFVSRRILLMKVAFQNRMGLHWSFYPLVLCPFLVLMVCHRVISWFLKILPALCWVQHHTFVRVFAPPHPAPPFPISFFFFISLCRSTASRLLRAVPCLPPVHFPDPAPINTLYHSAVTPPHPPHGLCHPTANSTFCPFPIQHSSATRRGSRRRYSFNRALHVPGIAPLRTGPKGDAQLLESGTFFLLPSLSFPRCIHVRFSIFSHPFLSSCRSRPALDRAQASILLQWGHTVASFVSCWCFSPFFVTVVGSEPQNSFMPT